MKKAFMVWLAILLLAGLFTVGCESNGRENGNNSGSSRTGNGDGEEGTFHSLQEAFELELLTVEDLRSIAYYHHNGLEWVGEQSWRLGSLEPTDYIPIPKNPITLSDSTQSKIKQDFVHFVKCTDSEHNVQISSYYGIYNGCVAAMIDGCVDYLQAEQITNICGITYYYGSSQTIFVWREQ